MEEKSFSERESLLLIQQMINTAKKEQRDDGLGWIIWGWLLFSASLLTVANLHFKWFSTFFFWNMFGVATILIFAYKAIVKYFIRRVERVKTYTGDLFSKLNAGFFICLMFIIIAMNVGTKIISQKQGVTDLTIINLGFALLINLYAFWALIYGTALSFKPSIVGAYCTWAIGLAALFAQDFEKVMWLQALAVLAGYLIPGHLANYQFRKLRRAEKANARV